MPAFYENDVVTRFDTLLTLLHHQAGLRVERTERLVHRLSHRRPGA